MMYHFEPRLRVTSNSDDSDVTAGSPDEPFYVIWIARQNRGFLPNGRGNDHGVDDIRGFTHSQQAPGFVRLRLAKRSNLAPRQEAPELGLLWGPTHLSDHRRGNQWNDAKFQAGLVIGPRSPLISVSGHKNGGVVDDRGHAERRTVRDARS